MCCTQKSLQIIQLMNEQNRECHNQLQRIDKRNNANRPNELQKKTHTHTTHSGANMRENGLVDLMAYLFVVFEFFFSICTQQLKLNDDNKSNMKPENLGNSHIENCAHFKLNSML